MILHQIVEDLLSGQTVADEGPLGRHDHLIALVHQSLLHLHDLHLCDGSVAVVETLRADHLHEQIALFFYLRAIRWRLGQFALARLC